MDRQCPRERWVVPCEEGDVEAVLPHWRVPNRGTRPVAEQTYGVPVAASLSWATL